MGAGGQGTHSNHLEDVQLAAVGLDAIQTSLEISYDPFFRTLARYTFAVGFSDFPFHHDDATAS